MESLNGYLYLSRRSIQGAPIKKQSPRKNVVFQPSQYGFEPNFHILYVSIHTTYPANFIKITDTIPQTDTAV